MTDFRKFCQQATNQQLENILAKEWEAQTHDPNRQPDYQDAQAEAEARGWTVRNGVRL